MRAHLRSRRREAASADEQASIALCDVFMSNISLPENCVVGAYIEQGSEMDPAIIVEVLRDQGFKIAMPSIEEIDGSLSFREYEFGNKLEIGPLKIPQPFSTVPLVEPDVILVPLLGFDRKGERLGQGRGYYDRYLASMRSKKVLIAIGLAYATQEEEKIPSAEHDQKLDAVVTEKEFIDPTAVKSA